MSVRSRVRRGVDRQERLQRDTENDGNIAEIRGQRGGCGSVVVVVLLERDGD
jgi:hypothetical protein